PYHPGLTTNVSWSMMIIGLRCGDGVHLGWLEQCDDGNEDDDDGCDRACNLAPHRAFTDPHKTLPVEGLTITCSGWHCWRFAVLSEGPHRVVIKQQHSKMTSEEADIGLDVANRAILRLVSSGRPMCTSNEVSLEWTRNSSELPSELCGRDAADDSDLVLNPGSHILRWRTRSAGFSGELGLAISPLACGDGLRVGPEECDDGNTRSKDGCSSTCEVEAGWICRGRARDRRDYCSRLMIPNVAILCTGAACDRLAVDEPWTGAGSSPRHASQLFALYCAVVSPSVI
ncbi:Extracellular matrix protein fras1, partial [Perkinsus olseni]